MVAREPSIDQVHQWAMQYAEVTPEKIARWRRLLKRKYWLPRVSLGVDVDKNRTVSDSLWGTSSGGGRYFQGPDDKSFDSNFNWDVSVTWDLYDIVWHNDQLDIDIRSRATVKLREEIIEKVTTLYFERRKLQWELLTRPVLDEEERVKKEMRLEQLTALINSFTGGRFSRNCDGCEERKNYAGVQAPLP